MELNDKEWQIVEPLFPELPTGHRGRPWRGNREVLDGILWILRMGAPWRDLPKKYPSYQTCHRRFQQWCIDGTLKSVLEMIAVRLDKQRKLNLSECCIDAKFVPAKKGESVSVKRSVVKGRN